MAHDGEQYWPSVENVSDQQGQAYTLTMRPVFALDALPAGGQREVRAGMDVDAYENESLAYLD